MNRQKVFCEIDFYKHFIDSYPNIPAPGEESIKQMKQWIDFNAFMFKSDIFFNINSEQFEDLANEDSYYKILWKRSANGECGVEFLPSDFPALTDFDQSNESVQEYFDAVFLTCHSKESCLLFESNFGIKAISLDNLNENNDLFNFKLVSIESGPKSYTNWRFLKSFQHVCNSLAIIDNYILSEKTILHENLFPILDSLLPNSLKIPFHISIFAKKEVNGRILNFQNFHDEIYSEIKRIRPDLNIKLGIFQIRNEIHDRNIITNYFILDSGSGFDLFKNKKARHQTKIIGFFPSFVSNIDSAGSRFIFDLKKTLKKIYFDAVISQNLTTYWGVKENRLFN